VFQCRRSVFRGKRVCDLVTGQVDQFLAIVLRSDSNRRAKIGPDAERVAYFFVLTRVCNHADARCIHSTDMSTSLHIDNFGSTLLRRVLCSAPASSHDHFKKPSIIHDGTRAGSTRWSGSSRAESCRPAGTRCHADSTAGRKGVCRLEGIRLMLPCVYLSDIATGGNIRVKRLHIRSTYGMRWARGSGSPGASKVGPGPAGHRA
jgi:hypothetical protein